MKMNELFLFSLVLLFTFLISVMLTKFWIKIAKRASFVGKDMNKANQPEIPEMGGVVVVFSIIIGLLAFIFLKTFLLISETHLVEILAILVTLLLAFFIGFLDDCTGWKVGLSQLQKVLLTIPIGLPLAVLNAGNSHLFGINFGLLFPLIIVPVAIIGSSNAMNLLAGYNFLECGLGIIILSTLGIFAFQQGMFWLVAICFIAVAALSAFGLFNYFPSKVFPGNSLTYAIGALIGSVAIFGGLEKVALILFIPYFLDAILYVRARVIDKAGDVQAFAKVNPDGSLDLPYPKIYDSTHLAIAILKKIKRKVYEPDVVNLLIGIEAMIAIIALVIGSL